MKSNQRSAYTKFLMVVSMVHMIIIAYFSVQLANALFEGDFLFSISYLIALLLSLFHFNKLLKTPLYEGSLV